MDVADANAIDVDAVGAVEVLDVADVVGGIQAGVATRDVVGRQDDVAALPAATDHELAVVERVLVGLSTVNVFYVQRVHGLSRPRSPIEPR